MEKLVKEYRELKRMAEEIDAEIEAIKDKIKEQMQAQGVDTITGADYKITYKEVNGSKLDSKALAADYPDIYAAYTNRTTCRRFNLV